MADSIVGEETEAPNVGVLCGQVTVGSLDSTRGRPSPILRHNTHCPRARGRHVRVCVTKPPPPPAWPAWASPSCQHLGRAPENHLRGRAILETSSRSWTWLQRSPAGPNVPPPCPVPPRCACIDVRHAHKASRKWTLEMDVALVQYVNRLCRHLAITPARLHPHEVYLDPADATDPRVACLLSRWPQGNALLETPP